MMPEANPIMILLLGLGAGMLMLGLLQLVSDLRLREDQRIAARLGGFAAATKPDHIVRDVESLQKSLIGKLLNAGQAGRSMARFLIQADVPWPAHQVVGGITVLMGSVLAVCLTLRSSLNANISAAQMALLTAVAGAAPLGALMFRRARRMSKLTYQLPEVFELLGQALRAGHGITNGIQLIGEQLPDPAGREFARTFQEQNFGVKLEEALHNLAERTGLLDMKMFVTAVLIQRQTGGDLAEVLDKSGEVIRDRLKIAGAVKALTAEGRLSGWVLTCLPVFVAVMIYRFNPKYIEELLFGDANYLLKIAVFMNVLGFVMIQKIIRVKF